MNREQQQKAIYAISEFATIRDFLHFPEIEGLPGGYCALGAMAKVAGLEDKFMERDTVYLLVQDEYGLTEKQCARIAIINNAYIDETTRRVRINQYLLGLWLEPETVVEPELCCK